MQPRIRGNNLVTRYRFTEGYCVITNKSAYLDNDTGVKVMEVVAPVIRKMKASIFFCVYTILFFLYITPRIFPSKLS